VISVVLLVVIIIQENKNCIQYMLEKQANNAGLKGRSTTILSRQLGNLDWSSHYCIVLQIQALQGLGDVTASPGGGHEYHGHLQYI